MKLVITGTGNVAQVLGKLLLQANHTILQVFGRDELKVKQCAELLNADPITNLSFMNNEAEMCIIATSDNAVPVIASQLRLPNTIIVHTSGGVSISALDKHSHYGVLYPLQSMRKELPYLPTIPLFIDGNNNEVKTTIMALAKTISGEVHFAGDEERLKLHVAAVFCSNFTNYLFALANEFCNSEQLSFKLLMPLIQETVHRMQFNAPAHLQTGPAVRRDEITIHRHLQLLQSYPEIAQVYKMLTGHVQNSNLVSGEKR